jgi:uncharacterized surface protein with fasciclin (FAS1) repeats
MTYVAPYSQATLMYEPDEEFRVEVATPGTLLDYIGRTAPHFLQIIRSANMLALYNTISPKQYTVFVPFRATTTLTFDANTARRICRSSTVPGIITTDMLMSSPHLVMYNLNDEMSVSSDNGVINVNGQTVLYGDIKCSNGMIHVVSNSDLTS